MMNETILNATMQKLIAITTNNVRLTTNMSWIFFAVVANFELKFIMPKKNAYRCVSRKYVAKMIIIVLGDVRKISTMFWILTSTINVPNFVFAYCFLT